MCGLRPLKHLFEDIEMFTKLKYALLALCIFISAAVQADYPIYILLTHPRATATAFEKVMRTQEGLQVLHAPFLPAHIARKYGPDHSFTKQLPNPKITFEDVSDYLFQLAKNGPVFFKESGYLLVNFFKEHPEFYRNPQVKMAFLVRDPAKSIISYYKKMPTVNEPIIGHRQLWDLFLLLREDFGEIPLVLDSDEFLKDPLFILNQLGNKWGLNFDEDNLHWEKGYADDWHLKDWYVEVAESTELEGYRGDVPRDLAGTPLYAEVTNEKDRIRLQEFYRIQNGYYQNLLQYALKARK